MHHRLYSQVGERECNNRLSGGHEAKTYIGVLHTTLHCEIVMPRQERVTLSSGATAVSYSCPLSSISADAIAVYFRDSFASQPTLRIVEHLVFKLCLVLMICTYSLCIYSLL